MASKVRPKKQTSKRAPRTKAVPSKLSALREARLHLLRATNALSRAYDEAREDGLTAARPLASARDVALQTYRALAPGADAPSLRRLLDMANRTEIRLRVEKSAVEHALVEALFPIGDDGGQVYPVEELENATARSDFAGFALLALATAAHADSAKVLRRWQITDARTEALSSPRFASDQAQLADAIASLLDEAPMHGETIAHSIVRAMYRVVKLRRPFEALDAKLRRSARA